MLEKLFDKFPRIFQIDIHSTPENKIKQLEKVKHKLNIYHKTQQIDSSNHCGFISPSTFSINLDFYLESKLFNNCLNKKISVDLNGNIKNCPSFKKSYGNVSDISIKEVISTTEFKKMWAIKKDDVSDCNVCEFRYICSDCRAFTLKDDYSKPSRCSYNPYLGVWGN